MLSVDNHGYRIHLVVHVIEKCCSFNNFQQQKQITIIEASMDLIWLKNFVSKIGMQHQDCVLHDDNH